VLTKEQIMEKAPAVLSVKPMSNVSNKYIFISTEKVIDSLAKNGWQVSDVDQMHTLKSRKKDIPSYKQHLVRFRNEKLAIDKENIPELILVNSHDRSKPFRFYAGLFRLICSNGLIIAESKFESIEFRHIGIDGKEIIEVLQKSSERIKGIFSQIKIMKQIILSPQNKTDIARRAINMKWKDTSVVTPSDLLTPKREEDKKDDLWTVYNVVQENLMKGGVTVSTGFKRFKHTKAIRNISENVRVNTKLWEIVESKIK